MPNPQDLEKEKILIEEAKKNPDRFLDLYDKYFDQIYRYIYRRVGGDSEVTQDLASQTFLDALEHIKSFQFKGFPFSSWLYKIAHNNVIKWYRKNSNRHHVPIEKAYDLHDKTQIQEDKLESLLAQDQVNEMLSHLDEEESEILRLKFFEGLSNIEIAEIMNLSVSNIGVKVFRTLKKAKGLLPTKHDLKQFN